MEEEVELLHKATLLEKNGDKYTTNFFILDKECRLEIYHTLRNASKERSRLLREFMDDSLKTIRGLGIAGEHLDDNTIRWWLVPDHIDCLIVDIGKGQDIYDPPKRANGESWGFVGYEITELPEKTITGHNCYGNEVWVYKYGDYSLWDLCGDPEYEETELLSDCIRNKRTADSISGIEKGIWEKINNKYVHTSDSGEVIPDILVITEENFNKIHETFRCHKNYEPLIHNVKETYDKIEKIFKKYSHKVLHDSLGYNVRM